MFRLGLYRDAEKQYKSALNQTPMVETILLLGKVYIRLDQPLTAIETYQKGLENFQQDTSLLIGLARIYEVATFEDKLTNFSRIYFGTRVEIIRIIMIFRESTRWRRQSRATKMCYKRTVLM